MAFYEEPVKKLPVKESDVVIAGGGTAGVVAALASARQGARTALLEIKGYPGGTVVSVRLRDRPFDAVVADMVEGVVVANRLDGEPALRARTYLAEAVAGTGSRAADRRRGLASGEARVVERQTRAA